MLRTESPRATTKWESLGDLPFDNFEQLKAAVAIRSFNIGVDSLAAAEWAGQSNSRTGKTIVAALSLLLVVAAVAFIVAECVSSARLIQAGLRSIACTIFSALK